MFSILLPPPTLMRTVRRGTGTPEIAIVGGIHGDEPAGRDAIERVLEQDYRYDRPVVFVVANEEALAAGERYIDTDLNRAFPGDATSTEHEELLAAEIMDVVGDATVLDVHTTHSTDEPFAGVKRFDAGSMERIQATGVSRAVCFPESVGALAEHTAGVVVEAGRQGSEEAVENAVDVITNFLAYYDAIPREPDTVDPEFYRETGTVEGAGWEFLAENFERVERGAVYARRGDEELRAEEPFYPVLMSTEGYADILGHKAEKVDQGDLPLDPGRSGDPGGR